MQFHVPLDRASIDLVALQTHLQSLDPAAVADIDALGPTLRVSTSLDEHQIAAALSRSGLAVHAGSVERQPSTCCGGCGG